jgi:hypothetical protein
MASWWPLLLLLVFLAPAGAGCRAAGERQALSAGGDEPHCYSVAEIYKQAEKLQQRTITVRGRFMGWRGCAGKTRMTTRSDWTLADELPDGPCIFVSGDYPAGLNPRNKADRGKMVTIKALVIHEQGLVFLHHKE